MTALTRAFGARIGQRARRWASRRQGTDPMSVCLYSRRIYILPTRPGLIFGAILFAMLLGAMNYNNNMGFALTFLLAGVGIVSIHKCHRNLSEVYLHYRGARPVFAGNPVEFEFTIENRSPVSRWQIEVGWDRHEKICDELEVNRPSLLTLALPTERRGRISPPRIQLSTCFPLGLFRAWAWVNMDIQSIVYPQPAETSGAPMTGDPKLSNAGRSGGGDDDFSGLRNYRLGDPPRHIAWKRFARTGEKLITEYRDGPEERVWIDWFALPGGNTEERLRWMTRAVLDCDRAGRAFGLRLPDADIPPAPGSEHRHRCLKALALFETPPET